MASHRALGIDRTLELVFTLRCGYDRRNTANRKKSMTDWVYLHGFNSSPQSLKAQETKTWLERHAPTIRFHCPQLAPHPAQALSQAHDLISALPQQTLIIGSSLGGFYASWCAERLNRKAILVNPAVQPHQELQLLLGEQSNPYTGLRYTLSQEDVEVLAAHQTQHPDWRRYWLILGSADQVLDWRVAARHFQGCRQTLFNGDDHRLQRWSECLPHLVAFAQPSGAQG